MSRPSGSFGTRKVLFIYYDFFYMKHLFRPLALFAALALLGSCTKLDTTPAAPTALAGAQNAAAAGFPEAFETGTKVAYTSGTVALGSGAWMFDDALLGNTSADVKTGTQSARVRNSGTLTMNFDLTGGAGVVALDHARYGTDAAGTWELWASTNSGLSFSKVGSHRDHQRHRAGHGQLQREPDRCRAPADLQN